LCTPPPPPPPRSSFVDRLVHGFQNFIPAPFLLACAKTLVPPRPAFVDDQPRPAAAPAQTRTAPWKRGWGNLPCERRSPGKRREGNLPTTQRHRSPRTENLEGREKDRWYMLWEGRRQGKIWRRRGHAPCSPASFYIPDLPEGEDLASRRGRGSRSTCVARRRMGPLARPARDSVSGGASA
jgi:hypothetical protein